MTAITDIIIVCRSSYRYRTRLISFKELGDTQLKELSKLAKEIICPFIKTNKCEFRVSCHLSRIDHALARFRASECVYG